MLALGAQWREGDDNLVAWPHRAKRRQAQHSRRPGANAQGPSAARVSPPRRITPHYGERVVASFVGSHRFGKVKGHLQPSRASDERLQSLWEAARVTRPGAGKTVQCASKPHLGSAARSIAGCQTEQQSPRTVDIHRLHLAEVPAIPQHGILRLLAGAGVLETAGRRQCPETAGRRRWRRFERSGRSRVCTAQAAHHRPMALGNSPTAAAQEQQRSAPCQQHTRVETCAVRHHEQRWFALRSGVGWEGGRWWRGRVCLIHFSGVNDLKPLPPPRTVSRASALTVQGQARQSPRDDTPVGGGRRSDPPRCRPHTRQLCARLRRVRSRLSPFATLPTAKQPITEQQQPVWPITVVAS